MEFAAARTRLIDSFSEKIKDTRVLDAMKRIPRELFVPVSVQPYAYSDKPLPIGFNQTIAQPYLIALMTQALELKGHEKVLEIGTGSGYQAAILAELVTKVITTERFPELAENASGVLQKLGYLNIAVKLAEDSLGWVKESPYDAIIVTAGAPSIPNELISQLTIGGRMVIPAGTRYSQQLYRITRNPDKNKIEDMGTCYFVPLVGKGAWESSD